jgi:hypothetical protein
MKRWHEPGSCGRRVWALLLVGLLLTASACSLLEDEFAILDRSGIPSGAEAAAAAADSARH